jgi:hypothetical protein
VQTDSSIFFTKVPKNSLEFSSCFGHAIINLADKVFDLVPPTPKTIEEFAVGSDEQARASKIGRLLWSYKEKHAYEGTLLISLVSSYRDLITHAAFLAYRESVRLERSQNHYYWEIVRNIGRPTVPRELLAIFAVYEAEKRLEKPMENLSQQQIQLLGL